MNEFYSGEKLQVLNELNSNENGLSKEEAAKRLAENGKNELEASKKKSFIQKFLAQFKDVMIIVLIIAAIVSAAIAISQKEYGELIDSGIIMLIVIINAIIGLVQENKAEAALDALKNLNKPFSKVIRDDEIMQIRSEDLVVGDIIQLEAGDIVPADIRLVQSASLKIEEAALTGESVPIEKDCDAVIAPKAPLGDRTNMAYSSGIVTYGRGRGVVTATGMNTEVGKIAKMLSESDNQTTPLQNQLAKTAKLLSLLVLGIVAIIFGASLFRAAAADNMTKAVIIDSFMTSVAIAVAAIPEGLPAVVTIVLAIGVQKMSKKNAIIRNLPAVETLGCCEIICSDKTGTLTLNKMTVKKLYTTSDGIFADNGYPDTLDAVTLVRGMALCNDTTENSDGVLLGDPTETALVAYAKTIGFNMAELKQNWQRVNEIPFDSIRKLMSTINRNSDETVAHVKGAPDILLEKCDYIMDGGKIRKITAEDKENVKKANLSMAKLALRVLGVAIKQDNLALTTLEQDLIFVGLVGMIDPPRPEVKQAVKVCVKAGMRPIMITGDHIDTASAIASEIGILRKGDGVMLGAEIDTYTDEEFAKIIQNYSVFARVSPENKVKIVKAYKSLGKTVAMTGDGVNDAPSIKEADIGIGMGITGTDVSKGAADMVLADDNFATIINSVEEGRKIFSNIKKAIQFLLSANIAEVLCLFIATVFLNVKFLTPVMILWVNLVTDSLPALSLGMEEAEKDVMNYPPRKSKSSLFAGKTGVDILIQGIMQTGLVMLSFCLGNYVLTEGVQDHTVAMTMAFVTLCMIQLFHSFNLRSQTNTLFTKNMFGNKYLNWSFVIGTALICAVILITPLHAVFETASLTLIDWVISVGIAIAIIPLVEAQKFIVKLISKGKSDENLA